MGRQWKVLIFHISIIVDRRESMGGEEYYNVTMESLKPDTSTKVRGLSKKFVEFVNKNKTSIPITFKFVYMLDTFTMDIITKF